MIERTCVAVGSGHWTFLKFEDMHVYCVIIEFRVFLTLVSSKGELTALEIFLLALWDWYMYSGVLYLFCF